MSINPLVRDPFKVAKVSLIGFAKESAKAGENVWICTKDSVTSENPRFYVYIEQISKMIFSQISGVVPETISRSLIVIHKDESADVYINHFPESFIGRLAEGISPQEGSLIYTDQLKGIESVRFPDVKLEESDQVMYLIRAGFRFGLFFDLGRNLDLRELEIDIGKLRNSMMFDNFIQSSIAQMMELEKQNYDAYIIPEGKTDAKHLSKADDILGNTTRLILNDSVESRGDSELYDTCKKLSDHGRAVKPTIGMFDNDSPEMIAKLEKFAVDGKSYQSWGNNVYSFILPRPISRKNYKNISIEMLYDDKVIIAPDKTGKRLFFSNELEKVISMTTKGSSKIRVILAKDTEEFDKKIEDQDASQIVDEQGNQLAISKSAFAEQVFNGERALLKEDFTNFQPVFDIINQIIADTKVIPTINKN